MFLPAVLNRKKPFGLKKWEIDSSKYSYKDVED